MTLRPHQELAVNMLRESLSKGKLRPMLAAPCSFGKTKTAAHILASAQEKGKRGIFIADRIKLVSQTIKEFDSCGIDIGVMQGHHERYNPYAPIQIASIQTLAKRRKIPEFDIAIVDEAHTVYQQLIKMMTAYNNVPFIGLSATPYSKGLGEHYDDLVVPITTRQLLDQGYLCPVKYYGGHHVDLKGVKRSSLSTGGTDFSLKSLADATDRDDRLVGDVVKNWFRLSEGRQTIAFSPSIKSSKWMVDEFEKCGVGAEHIDCYTPPEQRIELFEAHDNGEFSILSCSQLLNTGYDAPKVSCLIDCYPKRSLISFIQMQGRVMRTSPGKEHANYHDHSGNIEYFYKKLGCMPEDVVPAELDDGSSDFSETKQIEKKEKEELKMSDCPQCYQKMMGVKCMECGYEKPIRDALEYDNSDLVELKTVAQKRNRTDDVAEKERFYGELVRYCQMHNKKPGFASHKYKSRYSVWPNKVTPANVIEIRPETMSWMKSQQIKWSKSR